MFCFATLKNCSLNLKKFSPGFPENEGHFIFSDFLGNNVAKPRSSSSFSKSFKNLSIVSVASVTVVARLTGSYSELLGLCTAVNSR